MNKYTKKLVTIEAFQFQRRNNGPIPYPDWFDDAVTRNDIITHNTGKWNNPTQPAFCEIKTLEGVMRADEGDWIIRGIKGEMYPCKPDIFEATYSPASPAPASVQEGQGWLTSADRETLNQIAGWLDSSARIVQNGPDDYGPATQFDYELGQAAAEINAILARQPAPMLGSVPSPQAANPQEQEAARAAVPEGWREQATYLQGLIDNFLPEFEKLQTYSGGYYVRRDAVRALFEQRVSYAAAPVAQEGGALEGGPPTCGDNSVLPARFVGCGQQIGKWADVYRCTHCDTALHKHCAEKHFRDDNVLTNAMIDSMTPDEVRKVSAVLGYADSAPVAQQTSAQVDAPEGGAK